MSPEERIRIRGLPSSSAATSEEREGVDEEEQGQGETKKARINFLEGRSYIHPAQPHLELAVNDDLEEMRWSEIMNIMIEGGFTDEVCAQVYDELTGKELDPGKVKEAREDEMEFVKGIKVYEEAPIQECLHRTGKKPIGTRWVDILKGELTRSRWVAQDFKKKGDNDREDLFAAMPPLEAKKALFRLGAVKMAGGMTRRNEKMKMMFVDVRKAHLNAKCSNTGRGEGRARYVWAFTEVAVWHARGGPRVGKRVL
jgi:hypothetical protein